MKDLAALRQELDQVDREIVALFEKRMAISAQVANCKISAGLPVLDRSREEQVLASRAAMLEDARFADDVQQLYTCIMALSRQEQARLMKEASVC